MGAPIDALEQDGIVFAIDAGFADQPHFTRAFRKAYGETPAEYSRWFRSR